MTRKEMQMTKDFGKSLSRFESEKVNKVLASKSSEVFMEAVKAIGDELLCKEAEAIYKEFGFAKYSDNTIPFEKYDMFNVYLKFNVKKGKKYE